MNNGFIPISRKFFENPFWSEDRVFSKCEAWLDLIQTARIEQSNAIINGKVIELQRGELCASIRFLAKRWTWGEQKIRTYLKMLSDLGMITSRQHRGETIVTLVNYGFYNDLKQDNNTLNNTGITQEQHRHNTGVTQNKTKKQLNKETTFIVPQLSDVENYFTEKGYSKELANKFFNYYAVNNWKDAKGSKVQNWKQKAIANWFEKDNKIYQKTEFKSREKIKTL